MVIREEIEIEAPLAIVWSVFTCLDDWGKWNTVCRAARRINQPFAGGKPISEGDCISFAVRPVVFPVRITPRITKCIPEKEIVWEGRRFGIRAEHSFTFTECGEKILVLSTEKFRGVGLLFSRVALVPSRLHQLTRELLGLLRKEAESRAFSRPWS